jgi:ATP-dependent exoDNAse (exonuclease V) beta subunit
MHSSKGLEFPIVINVLSGTDNNSSDGYRTIQLESGESQLYWNSDTKINDGQTVKQRFYQERDEERSRLYYVAFTRASLYQYIPVYEINEKLEWPFDL